MNQQNQQDFAVTVWDVGHGLCIWIQTPNGQNHWIDCKKTDAFSPSAHVRSKFGVTSLDYLIISHPDTDHISDLPSVVEVFGKPKVLHRNKTLPDAEKYKSGTLDCQTVYKSLDTSYTTNVSWENDPCNPAVNGGVEVSVFYNNYSQTITGNNTSVVALYLYAGWLFVCPGDIEDLGWVTLWNANKTKLESFIAKAKWRVLVAPHHGRSSGYSQSMMDAIKPHLVIISDETGQSETDRRFRENPAGLKLTVAPDTEDKAYKFLSTKGAGRVRFEIGNNGGYRAHQYEYWK